LAGHALAAGAYRVVCPVNLAVQYPGISGHPAVSCCFSAAAAALLLAALARAPEKMKFGALLFLLPLFPVIPYLASGFTAADRYFYVPQVGLFIMAAAAFKRFAPARARAVSGALIAAVIVAAAGLFAYRQCGVWHDSGTLWRHALAGYPSNEVAHSGLGDYLVECNDYAGASREFSEAIRLDPGFAKAYLQRGAVALARGNAAEALPDFEQVLRLRPDSLDAYRYAGDAYRLLQRYPDARRCYDVYIGAADPDPRIYYRRGDVRTKMNDPAGAADDFRCALQIDPACADAYYGLLDIVSRRGDRAGRDALVRTMALHGIPAARPRADKP
jgi:tetratricopeptide (TPR) repeat protein